MPNSAPKPPSDDPLAMGAADDAHPWATDAAVLSPDELLARLESLNHQLAAVQQGLARSHRLATVGTLTATLIHEYNNLMTPLVSYAQMALAEPDDQALTTKALEKALNSAQQAGQISQALLGFVREDPPVPSGNAAAPGGTRENCSTAETGDQPPSASLQSAVQAASECLARDPAKDGIAVDVDVNEVRVAIDPVAMQHILLNLLLNARKAILAYDRRQGGRITIRATPRRDRVDVEFADTGRGIPEHLLGRIFEPFVSDADDNTDDAGNLGQTGTGLGLALCRHFVEQAGGSIRVHNRPAPDSGAVFTLELPAG